MIKQNKKRSLVPFVATSMLLGSLGVLLLAGLLLRPVQANAATSSTINFQARLLTNAGGLVPDGNYNVEFKIYDASSSSGSSQGSCTGDAHCLWTETRTSTNVVRVANGYLTVNLGSVTSFPSINWDQQLWLSMNIGGTSGSPTWDGEMSPRLQLTAVPYAFRAGQLAVNNSGNVATLGFSAPSANETILLPTTTGTQYVCYQGDTNCGFAAASGSSNYINLQGTTPGSVQTGNFNISGTGKVAVLDSTGTSLSIGPSASSGITLQQNTTIASGKTLGVQGNTSIQPAADGTAVFNVLTHGGSNVLTVDTTDARVGINMSSTPSYALDVVGDINSSTALRVAGTSVCDTSGTTGCIAKSGSGYYIHNQTTVQAANMYVQAASTGTVAAKLQAFNGGSGDILDFLNGSGTTVGTVSSTGAILVKPSTNTTTALQVQDSSANTVADVDTSNQRLGVNTSSPSSTFQVNQGTLAPGTVSNSASSPNVTGSSTTFTSTFGVGDTFTITSSGNTCTILSITSDTALTCTANLSGSSSGSAYTLSNATRLAVKQNGNVGIGTSSPSRLLDVAANNTQTAAPMSLLEQAGTGDATLEFKTPSKSFIVGQDASDGSKFKISSSVASSGSTILGYSTAGGTTETGMPGNINCNKFTASASGSVTSMWVYAGAVNATTATFQAGIYTDDGGSPSSPSTLVGHSGDGTLLLNAWASVSLSGTNVTSGQVYWVCVELAAASGTQNNLKYDTGTSNQTVVKFGVGTGTWNTSFGTPDSHYADKYSAYAVVTPTGSYDSFTRSLFALGDTGQATFQNSNDSSTAFQIQNAAGTTVFDADTTNSRVGIGTNTPAYTLDVAGDINTSTALRIAGTSVCDTTGSTGCTAKSGSGFYIHNQTTVQAANMYVQAATTGTVAAKLQAFNGGSADILDLLNGTGGTVASFASAGGLSLVTTTNSATALNVQNASSQQLFNVSTSTSTISIGPTGSLAVAGTVQIANSSGAAQAVTLGSTSTSSTTTIQGGTTSSAIAITTGTNGSIALTANGTGSINFATNSSSGQFFFQSNTNSTTALQVKASGGLGTTVLDVDTSNARVGINTTPGTYSLEVNGDANVGAFNNYRVGGTIMCNASGCTPASGSSNYIQNNSSMLVGQSANMYITSAGSSTATARFQAPIGGTGDLLQLANGLGVITMSDSSSGSALFRTTTNATSGFQVQNSSNVSQLAVDTSNSRIILGTSGGDTTGTILVLGTKTNAGDPTEVDGALYYNNSTETFRCGLNGGWVSCMSGIRKAEVFSTSNNPVAGDTIASATSGTFTDSSWTVPSGDCTPGRMYRITAGGVYSSNAGVHYNLQVTWNGTAIGETEKNNVGVTTPIAASSESWYADIIVTCYTNGSSALAAEVRGLISLSQSTTNPNQVGGIDNVTAGQSITNGGTQALALKWNWGTSSASNSVTMRSFMVESLGP